jgi:FkbH-like protein
VSVGSTDTDNHAGDAREILAWLDEKPTLSRHVQAARRLHELQKQYDELFRRMKLLFVRNFTIEPIEAFLAIAAYRAGFEAELSYSSYEPAADEYLEQLLGNEPDVVFLALRLEELAPALMKDFLGIEHGAARELAEASVDRIVSLTRRIRDGSPASILVHNFVTPLSLAAGLADSQDPGGQLNLVRRMNVDLAEAISEVAGAHIIDVDYVFAGLGLPNCYDERGDRASGAPLSPIALRALADSQVRHVQALKGATLKCVIVDCDNTLWGGVVGEDGRAGLLMGDKGSGRPYHDLQQALRDLRRRGILLAICSKNEEKDVLGVLRNHPDSLLHEDDFAAMRINWSDKAENIESIASELNLSLEHMLFIDDNPVECEWIRARLPAIKVMQWSSASGHQIAVADIAGVDSLVVTAEDRTRTESYRSDAKRRAASQAATSKEEYLRSLEMVAVIGSARPELLPRLAQLTQRTNQFNLTTRRYDVSRLQEIAEDPNARLVWLDLQDRFGANGIVGCGIIRLQGVAAVIDSLLLSCRVIGRGAEAVLVTKLAVEARGMGASALVGEYIPSDRNAQVQDLYGRLGFTGPEADGETQRWSWALAAGIPESPDWFKVVDRDSEGV